MGDTNSQISHKDLDNSTVEEIIAASRDGDKINVFVVSPPPSDENGSRCDTQIFWFMVKKDSLRRYSVIGDENCLFRARCHWY